MVMPPAARDRVSSESASRTSRDASPAGNAPDAPPPAPRPPSLWPPILLVMLVGTFVLAAMYFAAPPSAPPPGVVTVRPSASLLVAIRDLARLETTELHIEKVIDLSDRQSRLFGLVEATDAMLLVAAGDVTIGIDLAKIGDNDVSMDPQSGVASLRLPSPEILSSRLDEKGTYVYTRSTDVLAKRNENLETRARQEALAAIEKAAREADMTARAKQQAERSLRALVTQ